MCSSGRWATVESGSGNASRPCCCDGTYLPLYAVQQGLVDVRSGWQNRGCGVRGGCVGGCIQYQTTNEEEGPVMGWRLSAILPLMDGRK